MISAKQQVSDIIMSSQKVRLKICSQFESSERRPFAFGSIFSHCNSHTMSRAVARISQLEAVEDIASKQVGSSS